jgi:hypothetical protein
VDPTGFILGVNTARRDVMSARPDAPVVPEPPPRHGRGPSRARRVTATVLRRLADRLEPCQPAVS